MRHPHIVHFGVKYRRTYLKCVELNIPPVDENQLLIHIRDKLALTLLCHKAVM